MLFVLRIIGINFDVIYDQNKFKEELKDVKFILPKDNIVGLMQAKEKIFMEFVYT